ncbi:ribosome-associated translation inhibitor RaiA [Brachybacterium endophyticum]|uniref:Ribosome hibernation promoting factor n=1 Tax=Brachybacterium endophyticum TaxID=2182385 RepID=A0A2U2RH60_9MICO|nr:ribosome-associated translation inhibitor RaiA [Brachybacterium endophyticum]PWH05161.1 ribosome-associated translation inhibitor RaiA [Brachybacterium endophyticum]
MEINVVGRHMDVPERFRRHLSEKLEKVTQLAPAVMRVDVELSEESNPRQSEQASRVELTVHDDGAVIRSEARADDLFGALDVAYGKLLERLRRARDRRKDHRRGRGKGHGAESVRTTGMTGEIPLLPEDSVAAASADEAPAPAPSEDEADASPVVIREKKHKAAPMGIDDALNRMELVGHDFFLFIDEATGNPKVVYRRRGWHYGVIELERVEGEADVEDTVEEEFVARSA